LPFLRLALQKWFTLLVAHVFIPSALLILATSASRCALDRQDVESPRLPERAAAVRAKPRD
jgi:hypothetical protein